MSDPTNDIDALLRELAQEAHRYLGETKHSRRHAALTALVAERDALRKECNNRFDVAKIKELVAERDALKQRVAELEAHPPADRDLRDRLVESALRGAGTGAARSVKSSMLTEAEAEALGRQAVWMAEGAFDAMRKGATDGK